MCVDQHYSIFWRLNGLKQVTSSGTFINLHYPLLQCLGRTQSLCIKMYICYVYCYVIIDIYIYIYICVVDTRYTCSCLGYAGSASFRRFRERWRQELSRSCPKCISAIPRKLTLCTQKTVGCFRDYRCLDYGVEPFPTGRVQFFGTRLVWLRYSQGWWPGALEMLGMRPNSVHWEFWKDSCLLTPFNRGITISTMLYS